MCVRPANLECPRPANLEKGTIFRVAGRAAGLFGPNTDPHALLDLETPLNGAFGHPATPRPRHFGSGIRRAARRVPLLP